MKKRIFISAFIILITAAHCISKTFEPSSLIFLYHRDPDVRIKTIQSLAASGNKNIIDDLIRAYSIESYTPVKNAYIGVLKSITGRKDIRDKGPWKSWLNTESENNRLKIDFIPLNIFDLDFDERKEFLPIVSILEPEYCEEMASILTSDVYDRDKCNLALQYMVANGNNERYYEVQKFLISDWLTKLLSHKNIDINSIAHYLNGLANPGLLRDSINIQVRICLNSPDTTVVENTLHLLAGVEGYLTIFTVPNVGDKVATYVNSSVPEIAAQAKRVLEKIGPTQVKSAATGGNIQNQTIASSLSQDYWLQFDGIDDYVSVDDNPSLDLKNKFTLEAWINFEEGGTDNPRIISKGWERRSGYEFTLESTRSKRRLGLDMANMNCVFSNSYLEANKWYHIAATYDGSQIKLFINGKIDQTQERSVPIVTNDIKLNIGRNSETFRDIYKGKIAEVRIWNIARTEENIREDMSKKLNSNEEGLVGCWLFGRDKSEIVKDVSRVGNNATIVTTGNIPVVRGTPAVIARTDTINEKRFFEILKGKVLDAQDKPVEGSVVILCDQKTGSPICKDTFALLSDTFLGGQKGLVFTVSNDKGEFVFENIPAGEYRLIAQSWKDGKEIKDIFEKNGEVIELNGIAEHIKVETDNTENVTLRSLGTGVLYLEQSDATIVVLSTKPTRADPILGFAGWGGEFAQNILCGNRIPSAKTTIMGLPEGTVYLAMFANDNIPGWLDGKAEIESNSTTKLEYIPFVNGWSNSRHDPPEELLPIFNEVKEIVSDNPNFILNIYKDIGITAESGLFGMMTTIGPHLEKELVLPSGQKTTIGDFIASCYYIQLQQVVEQREKQAKSKKAAEEAKAAMGTAEKGSYKEAFIDLYDVLGRQYPCFEMKGIDWKAVGQEFMPRIEKVTNDLEFGLLCMELVARLEDSHANLQEGTAKLPEISFPQWDPGFACLEDDKARPVVYYIDKNSPAEKAGIKIGMVVKSINGKTAEDVMADTMQFYKKYVGYSSERYLRYHALQFFLRQEKQNSIVKLELLALDGEVKKYELPAAYKVRYLPRLPVPMDGIDDSGEVSWKMLDSDIGYIYVRRIGNNLITLLDKAVDELKKAKGIIIDVRGNSGGGFDANKAFLNFAMDKDSDEPERPRFKGPIALLIDSRCISAGEGWASWFVATKRAAFFGSATAGASSRKTTYELKNGLYKVQFSVKAYTGSLNRPIERIGLVPDVPVTQNADDLAKGIDTVLETAKEYLIEKSKE
ncbi:MAG: hypothetical protein JW787_03110 [Sedimentisphaerales bacterium]|nr:hypothetical protein [Sedimentisphaerales bacterium]